MNRAQRRNAERKGIKVKAEPVLNMKASDISKMKKDATGEAANLAFVLMLGIPAMVIHDRYPKLMKREEDGKGRVERFCDLCLDLYDSFEKGYVTLDDLHECLKEEAGITLL